MSLLQNFDTCSIHELVSALCVETDASEIRVECTSLKMYNDHGINCWNEKPHRRCKVV